MIKRIPALILLISSAFILSACNTGDKRVVIIDKAEAVSDRANQKQAILDMYATWNKAVEAGDRAGYLALLHDDIRMVPQAAEDITGIDAYGKFLVPVFSNATYKVNRLTDWDIEFLSDDIAQVRYDYIIDITMIAGSDTITDSKAALSQMSNNLKYNDVVKRDSSGNWKVLRHMWNAGYERKSE